jgi:hypothetical protein
LLVAVLALAPLDSMWAADPDAAAIYFAARDRAGGGREAGQLVDYAYDLLLTLPSGDNEVQIRGSVIVILPDLVRQQLETPQGPTQLVFDRGSVWQLLGGKKQDLPAEAAILQTAELARRHVLFGDVPDQQLIRYRREDEVGGRPVDVIEIIDVGGAPLRLYIDRESKDLLKQVYVGDIPGGGMAQVEELFSDFVEVSGIRFATRREVIRNGQPGRKSALSDVRVNSDIRREFVVQ